MKEGKFYPGIEKDPRKSKDADEKISLSNTANYDLTRQKTRLADANVHVTQMPKGAMKQINKLVEKTK